MTTGKLESVSRYWLCPLYSFDCDCESVDLVEGIQIKTAPKEFKTYIVTDKSRPTPYDEMSIPDWILVLPCSEVIEEPEYRLVTSGPEVIKAVGLLINFIQACRIHQQGSIFPGDLVLVLPTTNEWAFGIRMRTYLSQTNWHSSTTVYKLKKADIPKINKLMENLEKAFDLEKQDSINIALRRFNSAYDGELEDRLIDQMISFESLYIGDDKELGYKLRLRTAFLLGKQRAKIFKDMKKAYDLRGQIVHGAKKAKHANLEEIVPNTEEYLRQSIRRFLLLLSKGMSLQEIRDKLDENILKNGRILTTKE